MFESVSVTTCLFNQSGHPEMLLKIAVLKNFENNVARYLCFAAVFENNFNSYFFSTCEWLFLILLSGSQTVFPIIIKKNWNFKLRFWKVLATWKFNSKKMKNNKKLIWDKTFQAFQVNPYWTNAPFWNPLKTSENRKFFWCFQGVPKGNMGSI